MDVHVSDVMRAVVRLATPAFVAVLVFLVYLTAPGSAKIYTTQEIIQEILDPCFLDFARSKKRDHPELYADKTENDISEWLKANSSRDVQTMALKIEQTLGGPDALQHMSRKERFDFYRVGKEACISGG